MSTVREIILDALVEIGVCDPTMPLDAAAGAHALRVLNRMLDSWSTEDLLVYTENRNAYALTSGVQEVTLGIGGTINVARPVNITRASILLTASTPNTEITIPILTTQEWQRVCVKGVTGSFPTAVYITGDFPLQKLEFWPIPSQACSVVLYTWGQLTAFSAITDSISLPKGYLDAIVYNLACRLAPTYGRQIHPATASMAQLSKQRVRTLNSEPIYIDSDLGISGNAPNMAIKSFGIVVD